MLVTNEDRFVLCYLLLQNFFPLKIQKIFYLVRDISFNRMIKLETRRKRPRKSTSTSFLRIWSHLPKKSLKELRNYKWKAKTKPTFLKSMFFTINLHFAISNQIPLFMKLNLLLTSSTYLAFLPLEMHKKLEQTKVYQEFFLLCLKRNDPQTFKSGSCKNPFLQCVCYCYNLLRWMFFILCDNWKTL